MAIHALPCNEGIIGSTLCLSDGSFQDCLQNGNCVLALSRFCFFFFVCLFVFFFCCCCFLFFPKLKSEARLSYLPCLKFLEKLGGRGDYFPWAANRASPKVACCSNFISLKVHTPNPLQRPGEASVLHGVLGELGDPLVI